MIIALAADHGGYHLKEQLKPWLIEQGYEVQDFGANALDEGDDYPDFGKPAAEFVAEDADNRRAILFCKSGQGMAIAANKIQGIRALHIGHADEFTNHEAPNVISFAADSMNLESTKSVIERWLQTNESELAERHQRRIEKIEP